MEGRIGQYQILRALQPGGVAEVFIALRDGDTRPCVLKRLKVALAQSEIAQKRFFREAEIVRALSHENIAQVLDYSVEDDDFCIAMEWVEGLEVAEINARLLQKNVRMPIGTAIGIAVQALDGLSFAHNYNSPDGKIKGLVHRDISLRNLMLRFDGVLKVIDFGLVTGGLDELLTASGVLLGTPRYISPEQVRCEAVDGRADLYSLGAVLFELLTGGPLVTEQKASEALFAVLEKNAPLLSDFLPNAPTALTPVLARALEKRRSDRFPTALAFRDALLAAVGPMMGVSAGELGEFVRTHLSDQAERIHEIHQLSETDPSLDDDDTIILSKMRSLFDEADVSLADTVALLPDEIATDINMVAARDEGRAQLIIRDEPPEAPPSRRKPPTQPRMAIPAGSEALARRGRTVVWSLLFLSAAMLSVAIGLAASRYVRSRAPRSAEASSLLERVKAAQARVPQVKTRSAFDALLLQCDELVDALSGDRKKTFATMLDQAKRSRKPEDAARALNWLLASIEGHGQRGDAERQTRRTE